MGTPTPSMPCVLLCSVRPRNGYTPRFRYLINSKLSDLMKIALAALVFLAATGSTPAQPADPNDGDAAAIRTLVDHWREMWDRFDASSLQNDYADDADFVNAFGTRLKGRAEIVAFAARVVQRPNVQDRRTTWSPPLIRFVRPDVAVVSRDYETAGFRTLSGHAFNQGIPRVLALDASASSATESYVRVRDLGRLHERL